MYNVITSKLFLEQVCGLSPKSKKVVDKKLDLLKINPYRYKTIKGYPISFLRIRFSDRNKEKRMIYFVDKNIVKIICILDRDKDYKDLNKYIELASEM